MKEMPAFSQSAADRFRRMTVLKNPLTGNEISDTIQTSGPCDPPLSGRIRRTGMTVWVIQGQEGSHSMKRTGKRAIGLVVVMLICSMLMGTTASAGYVFPQFGQAISGTKKFAITKPKKPIKIYVGAYDGSVKAVIKSNRKNVVKCKVFTEKVSDIPVIGLSLKANKVGKAKMTVTYKHSGGTVKKTVTLITYQWGNPIKKLKIGGKNFSKAFKKTNEKTIAPVSGKLNIKLNSGYKKLQVFYIAKGTSTYKKISKSATVDLKSGDTLVLRFTDSRHKVRNSEAIFRVK